MNNAEKFKKLKIATLYDLALIIPHSFEDTTVLKRPEIGQSGAVEVNIKSHSTSPNRLLINAFCITWNLDIALVIFNPYPFHYASFKVGKTLFVLGKVEYNFSKFQIIQPKIITKTGVIMPKYKTTLKNVSMINLIKTYVSEASLLKAGLDSKNAKILASIHKGDKQSVKLLNEDFEKIALRTLKYVEILNFLQKLSKKKKDFEATERLNGDESEFITSLPFNLTNDQKNAINDIKKDLQKNIAAKRIVMGDVGCGKTMVIFSAVCMAYPKKSVLMVPTTILANQIYGEALKYLKLKTALVVSKEKKLNLEEFDFIIGTHALLFRKLPKCDLVMIDEQHRFGTNQRKLIHELVSKSEKHPHFLQFSATPIPRTMSLINSSIVDYSFIKQTPFKKDITTKIINKSEFSSLISHIESEIKKGNQTIIIYPLIEPSEVQNYQSIDEGRGFWEKRFKNVFVTHGKDKNKEKILQDFRDKGNILLATTMVEVGISLPLLSTIVIVGAEKLGLSSLHQLRGRVSRNGLKGYCFLFSYSKNTQRLQDFAQTTNGFEIAELDLQYRQSGDLLNGLIQHGVSFKYFDIKKDKKVLEEVKKALG